MSNSIFSPGQCLNMAEKYIQENALPDSYRTLLAYRRWRRNENPVDFIPLDDKYRRLTHIIIQDLAESIA